MISYRPFVELRKKTGITTYQLITKYNISSATIDRIRKGLPISFTTLNDLCYIYSCSVQDIIEFIPNENEVHK